MQQTRHQKYESVTDTWCSETVLTTGSIIPLSRDVTMILYGLNHSGTCSWCQIDYSHTQNSVLFDSPHTAASQASTRPALPLLTTQDKALTCRCRSTWYARSSCRRSSPHFTMTGTRRHADKWPYGDDSRILCTFSSQGSLSAAADGSSGSCCWHSIHLMYIDRWIGQGLTSCSTHYRSFRR